MHNHWRGVVFVQRLETRSKWWGNIRHLLVTISVVITLSWAQGVIVSHTIVLTSSKSDNSSWPLENHRLRKIFLGGSVHRGCLHLLVSVLAACSRLRITSVQSSWGVGIVASLFFTPIPSHIRTSRRILVGVDQSSSLWIRDSFGHILLENRLPHHVLRGCHEGIRHRQHCAVFFFQFFLMNFWKSSICAVNRVIVACGIVLVFLSFSKYNRGVLDVPRLLVDISWHLGGTKRLFLRLVNASEETVGLVGTMTYRLLFEGPWRV